MKSGRTLTSCADRVRFHVATQVSQTSARITPPPGFKGVTACLQRDSSSLVPAKTPLGIRQPDMVMEPTVAMMYATCIIQDEATGVTYMDMVTASVGRVALRNPHMAASLPRPTVEDITNLP